MPGWLAVPRDWVASFGDIVKFSGRVVGRTGKATGSFRCR